MEGWEQLSPVILWTVTQTAAVTGERVLGITPANPIPVNTNFLFAGFTLRVAIRTQITLDQVVVYGALGPVGLPGSGPAAFPPANFITEALWYYTPPPSLSTGQGVQRQPAILDQTTAANFPALIVPNWLLLEYTTSLPGGAPALTFEVWGTFIGPNIGGTQ